LSISTSPVVVNQLRKSPMRGRFWAKLMARGLRRSVI